MHSPEDLSHVVRSLPGGGQIIVVDTAAVIGPEAQAMMSARFSRWIGPTIKLIEDSFNRDVGKFIRGNYQAGYGHKSIGEMGEAVIFVEGVSMLCAKAIQDFPLYRGQESSTRYIDFSKQRFLNPVSKKSTSRGALIQEQWRSFYLRGLDTVIPHLREQYPIEEGEDPGKYTAAIKARALDIMRAFLPAGATTNVAWVSDLRHINDHLALLRHHPLKEVRNVGIVIERALAKKYPDSFDPQKRYEATESYLGEMGVHYTYFEADAGFPEFQLASNNLSYALLDEYDYALRTRPAKTELPWSVRECGTLRFEYLLDFGSFRDLQRHRAIVVPMPLLTAKHGFESWYIEQLPEEFAVEASDFISQQIFDCEELGRLTSFNRQYYLPMGLRMPIRETADLRGLVYKIELRSTRFVHPTLVRRCLQQAAVVHEEVGTFVQLHLDPEPNRFDVRRAEHDFVKKH